MYYYYKCSVALTHGVIVVIPDHTHLPFVSQNQNIYFICLPIIFEPRHDISNNVVCATSKDSDQPAHTRSLIRAFASQLNILLVLSY